MRKIQVKSRKRCGYDCFHSLSNLASWPHLAFIDSIPAQSFRDYVWTVLMRQDRSLMGLFGRVSIVRSLTAIGIISTKLTSVPRMLFAVPE